MATVFGFDIDGVLTADDDGQENTWVVEAAKFFDRDPIRASFRLDEALGLEQDQVEAFFRAKGAHILRHVPIRPDCAETIVTLKELGHPVHLITARNEGFREITESWLDEHAIPYDSLTMNDSERLPLRKGQACRSLKVQLFVDDNYENCRDIHNHSVPVLMFHASHNREQRPFVPIVHSWQDIRRYIAEHGLSPGLTRRVRAASV